MLFTEPQSSVITVVHPPQMIHFNAPDDKRSNIALTSNFKMKQPGFPGFTTYERV
jgi:hypothetical protein